MLCYAKSLQSCSTLCDPMDGSPPGSPVLGFSRQEYWSRLPFLSPGDLSDPGIKPRSPALQADALPNEPPGKPNLHSKRSWSQLSGLLTVWSTIAFWIPWNHYVWEVCSANRWDAPKTAMPAASIGQHKRPNCPPQPVKWIGLWSFASFAIFTWPLTNQLPLLQASRQLFAGRTVPQPAGGRRCFPRVRGIPKHGFLCHRNKRTYFSLAKMHWL